MSESDLIADQDAFFERKGLWKTVRRTFKVYVYSKRKCTTLLAIFEQQK
jgi:hypothetical protein